MIPAGIDKEDDTPEDLRDRDAAAGGEDAEVSVVGSARK
jgi:hypothetical protein